MEGLHANQVCWPESKEKESKSLKGIVLRQSFDPFNLSQLHPASLFQKHNDFFPPLNIWVENQRKGLIEFHMVNVPEAAELHDRWATAANNGWEWREMHFQGIKQGKASQWQWREEKQIIKLIASSHVASRTLAEMLIAFLFSFAHWIGGVCAWERQGTHDSQTDAHTHTL